MQILGPAALSLCWVCMEIKVEVEIKDFHDLQRHWNRKTDFKGRTTIFLKLVPYFVYKTVIYLLRFEKVHNFFFFNGST